MCILYTLVGFNARQWGYVLPPIEPVYPLPEPRDRDRLFDGLILTLKNGHQFRLMDTVFHQHSLIGEQCLSCVGTEVNKGEGWEGMVIVKFSWPSKSRTAEPTIIEEARQLAIESGDNWVLRDRNTWHCMRTDHSQFGFKPPFTITFSLCDDCLPHVLPPLFGTMHTTSVLPWNPPWHLV